MIQDGNDMNLGEPLNSWVDRLPKYVETSQKRRGLTNDSVVVGLTGITLSVGKPRTWGSGQQWRDGFSACLLDTRRSK